MVFCLSDKAVLSVLSKWHICVKCFVQVTKLCMVFRLICCLIWFYTSQSTIFQLRCDGSSLVKPVLSKDNCVLLKDTTQWCRWGSNMRPLSLESSTLLVSQCASYKVFCLSDKAVYGVLPEWRNSVWCFVLVAFLFNWQSCVKVCPSSKAVSDVLSRLAKLCVMLLPNGKAVCDVLFRMAKLCVMFCPGSQSCIWCLEPVTKLGVMFCPCVKVVYDVLAKFAARCNILSKLQSCMWCLSEQQSCTWCFVQGGKAVCYVLSRVTKLCMMFYQVAKLCMMPWTSDKAGYDFSSLCQSCVWCFGKSENAL